MMLHATPNVHFLTHTSSDVFAFDRYSFDSIYFSAFLATALLNESISALSEGTQFIKVVNKISWRGARPVFGFQFSITVDVESTLRIAPSARVVARLASSSRRALRPILVVLGVSPEKRLLRADDEEGDAEEAASRLLSFIVVE